MAGRKTYDRIWLATAGVVDRDRLRQLTSALAGAQAEHALEIRPVELERLPARPPAEHAVAPRRTAVLMVLGNLSRISAPDLGRLNEVLDYVRVECERRQWSLEVVDFAGTAETFVAMSRRPLAVLSSAAQPPALEALADKLVFRLFQRPGQSQRAMPPAQAVPPAPAPATRGLESPSLAGAEPATRGIEPAPEKPAGAAAAEPAPVRLGASAPAQVAPGSEFSFRFVAYPPADEAEVARLLTELSARSEHRLNVHECRWQPGTAVTVRASARQVDIAPAEQTFVWEGHRVLLDFDATVASNATEGNVVLKFDVAVDGIVVARLRLDLSIVRSPDASQQPVTTAASEPARSAFASYSSKDRERVLDRLAAVRIATGLDVFLDCLSLNPGEQWKPRLEREIKGRDLFLLFWSTESAASPWVEWEWRTALTEKGREAMQIHPLATGVKPPQELKDLHFGDVYMLVREAQVARRAEHR